MDKITEYEMMLKKAPQYQAIINSNVSISLSYLILFFFPVGFNQMFLKIKRQILAPTTRYILLFIGYIKCLYQ